MKKMISPSLMCGRIADYPHTLDVFAKTGIEYLHVDVMDGDFVPNLQFGTDTVRQLRGMSKIPLDIHLMIERPEDKLAWFDIQPGEYVSVHAESTKHLQKCLAMIRERGGKPMAAINPATPFLMLENVLGDLDGILVMTVNPGFAGQKLIPTTLEKVRELRVYLDARGYTETDIEVDGNVSFENARLLTDAGANIFVAGTSSVYKRDLRLEDAIAQMRKSIE